MEKYKDDLSWAVNGMKYLGDLTGIDGIIREEIHGECVYTVETPYIHYGERMTRSFKTGKEAVELARYFGTVINYVDKEIGVPIRRRVTKEPGTDPLENQK